MSIAFFDLDKTLIAENSASLWLNSQWKAKRIKLFHMLKASYWLARYHAGVTDLDHILEKSLEFIKGQEEKLIDLETKEFYLSTIKNLYRPGALDALKQHKKQGHVTSLLTSSFDGLCLLVQKELQIDHLLCSKLEVDENGFYTGRTIGPMCFGKNKIIFAQNLCEKLNVDLKSCYFYTDSASDMPLLSLVKNAIVVNPDPKLKAAAQLKKWPIVDWGKPNARKSENYS